MLPPQHAEHLGKKLMTLTGEAATPTSMTLATALASRVSTPGKRGGCTRARDKSWGGEGQLAVRWREAREHASLHRADFLGVHRSNCQLKGCPPRGIFQ